MRDMEHTWEDTGLSTGVDADWLEICGKCGAEKYTTLDQEGIWTESYTPPESGIECGA